MSDESKEGNNAKKGGKDSRKVGRKVGKGKRVWIKR